MPTTTINNNQREGLYELVRNHLGSIGDVWTALEETQDFETAERLGIEFGEDFGCFKTSAGTRATTVKRLP